MSKIVHICLCDAYEELWEYHRNLASNYDVEHGHSVYVITSSLTTDKNANWVNTRSENYKTANGIVVYRLKNRITWSQKVQEKLRKVESMYETLEEISPDIIVVHNLQTVSLYDVIKYKKNNLSVVLCGDSHADYFNSARNFISKNILNKIVYKKIIKDNIKYFNRFYFHGKSVKAFFEDIYSIKLDNYVMSTIGAKVESFDTVTKKRKKQREKLGFSNDKLYLIHSGKLEPRKKTKEILEALSEIDSDKVELYIIGNIDEEQSAILMPMIENDKRVHYLGWKTADELKNYLVAADLYLQPGTMSITLYSALANATPAVVYPYDDYRFIFSGWEYLAENEKDIRQSIEAALKNRNELEQRRMLAYNTAKSKLDISIFCNSVYETSDKNNVFAEKSGGNYDRK